MRVISPLHMPDLRRANLSFCEEEDDIQIAVLNLENMQAGLYHIIIDSPISFS